MPPTLLISGSLIPTNKNIKKEDLDKFVAVHFIIQLLKYKKNKPNPNIHDRIFLLQSLVGSGKTTLFVVEILRQFYGESLMDIPDFSREYGKSLDFNFDKYYNFPMEKKVKTATEDENLLKKYNTVLCAQPTTILAKNKAIEIVDKKFNPDLKIAKNVGYNTGVFKLYPSDKNSITYCTMGTLTVILQNKTDKDILENYSFILVDECHERSKEFDLGLGLLYAFLKRQYLHPLCPIVILMSATFDIPIYAKFLKTDPNNSIIVSGENPIRTVYHLDKPVFDVYTAVTNKVMELHEKNMDDPEDHCDILVFMPGDKEINTILNNLKNADKKKELYLGKITSELNQKGGPELEYLTKNTLDSLRKIVENPNIKRRVVVATAVVETGLTIETLKYMVDSCLSKYIAYSPIHNLSQLLVQSASQSSLTQRAGRVGRVKEGFVYRMMEEKLILLLDEYKRPDIFTTDITKMILDMMYVNIKPDQDKLLNNDDFIAFTKNCLDSFANCNNNCKDIYIGNLKKMEEKVFLEDYKIKFYPKKLLDLIPTDVYVQSKNKLISLGFYGTYIGFVASKVNRLSVESIRMVLAGYAYNVSMNDLIIIGLFVDHGNKTYLYTPQNMSKYDKSIAPYNAFNLLKKLIKKKVLSDQFFDALDIYNNILYDEFIEPLIIARWYAKTLRKYGPTTTIDKGKKIGINIRKINQILDTKIQVQKQFKKFGFVSCANDIDFNGDDIINNILRIKKCIHAGFKNNIAYLQPNGVHYKTNSGLLIIPKLQMKFKPAKIIYGSLFTTLKTGTLIYTPTPIYVMSLAGVI